MAKRKNPSRVNIPMCAAGVLLCLTLFSAHFTSGLYAKYTSTATGSDSARVAKFEVVTTGEEGDNVVVFTSGEATDDVYKFTIQNNSEVAVKYSLTLAPTNPLPDYISSTSFNPVSGNLAVGSDPVECQLAFNVDWAKFTEDASNTAALEKTFKFTIKVHVEQID